MAGTDSAAARPHDVRTLLRHYRRATADDRAAGARWYREARGAAVAIAADSGVSVDVAAGTIAALSPRMRWDANVRAAAAACAGRPYGALGNSKRAAARIIAGEPPADVLAGAKVSAFYRAIMGDDGAAVVDVWMARAVGDDAAAGIRPKRYREIAAAIARAASVVGVSAAAFQATVWVVVRGSAD
jgi:hypothetical protein